MRKKNYKNFNVPRSFVIQFNFSRGVGFSFIMFDALWDVKEL